MNKKSKRRTAFTFDERSLTTLENMASEGHFSSFSDGPITHYTEIMVRSPETGEERVIKIPSLPPLVRLR